jgi:toxin CcdB
MTQFCVHRNTNPANKTEVPYLLDIQHPLLSHIETRAVIPLYAAGTLKRKELPRLTPNIDVAGKSYLVMTPQLAGIPARFVGTQVANIGERRHEIIAAIDMLVSGI